MGDAGGGKVKTAWKKGGGDSDKNIECKVRTQSLVREQGGKKRSAAKAARAYRRRGDFSKLWIGRLGLVTHSSSHQCCPSTDNPPAHGS